ncbi:MAG: TipAS antibiotic-recognition domain-containing protein [Candidatus Ozemobacteraceae bacterium]
MEEYREEARAKWGKVVDESYRRVSRVSKEKRAAIQAEAQDITLKMAELMGQDPGSERVQKSIGRWFNHINANFYDCTLEVFRGLGTMYVEDERFKAFYENVKGGLALFMREAMHAYCDRCNDNV